MIRWLMLLSMVAAFWVVGQAAGLAAEGPSAAMCRAVTLTDRASGEVIIGAEDIAVDYAANLAYISAYDRVLVEDEVDAGASTISQGGIYLLDLNELSPFSDSAAVEDMTAAFKEEQDFRPHGIDLWQSPGGDTILHVINRNYVREGAPGDDRWRLRPAIERFFVGEGGALTHLVTLRPEDDDLMCSPNDLVVSPDGAHLFITNDHGACQGFGKFWEETLGLANGYLLYYDGAGFRRVAGDLAYPNGIALGGVSDDQKIFVSETRGERLAIYSLSNLTSKSGKDAERIGSLEVPGSPDNFTWTKEGSMLVAVLPDLFDFVFYRKGWFGVDSMASRIVSVKPPFGEDNVSVIFEDDGTLISGATVMAEARDVRLIGAVLDDHIVVCQKETSPLLSGPND